MHLPAVVVARLVPVAVDLRVVVDQLEGTVPAVDLRLVSVDLLEYLVPVVARRVVVQLQAAADLQLRTQMLFVARRRRGPRRGKR